MTNINHYLQINGIHFGPFEALLVERTLQRSGMSRGEGMMHNLGATRRVFKRFIYLCGKTVCICVSGEMRLKAMLAVLFVNGGQIWPVNNSNLFMVDTNSSSDFLLQEKTPLMDGVFTNIEEIPSQGFNLLIKAKRYGKWFVLKGLKAEYRQHPVYQQVLKKEFDIMVQLSHPSIVSVFSWEEVEPYGSCIVMEYVDGITLAEFLAQKQTKSQRLRILYNILDVLRYVHARQVTHRDLKPTNILITHNNRNVKVIDFGLSDTDDYSILKDPAGTLRYMSPEQQVGNTPDVRNDIFSLGVMMRQFHLGHGYQAIVHRCLDRIDRRYANVDQLEQAIRRVEMRQTRYWRLALTGILLGLVGVIGWQGRQIYRLSAEREQAGETIYAMNRKIFQITDSLDQLQDIRQSLETQLQKQQKMELAISEGKRVIDRYVKTSRIENYMDTLSNLVYLQSYNLYNEVVPHLWQISRDYTENLSDDFTEDERVQIESLINSYTVKQYTEKWVKRIEDLSAK